MRTPQGLGIAAIRAISEGIVGYWTPDKVAPAELMDAVGVGPTAQAEGLGDGGAVARYP